MTGTWRLLSASYQSSVFSDLLDAVVQNDWNVLAPPGVPLAQLQQELAHPLVAIRQCCKIYGSVVASSDTDSAESCTLDASKIASFCAKQLFEEQRASASSGATDSDGWVLDQFMDKWALRVPENVRVSVDMLRGVGLIKKQRGKPTRVVYLNAEDLPLDAKQRFETLFGVQEKWTIEQLEPFIQYVHYALCRVLVLLLSSRHVPRAGSCGAGRWSCLGRRKPRSCSSTRARRARSTQLSGSTAGGESTRADSTQHSRVKACRDVHEGSQGRPRSCHLAHDVAEVAVFR